MKKYIAIFAALVALVSCRSLKEEWQPVGGTPKAPAEWDTYDVSGITFTTIHDLKKMYTNQEWINLTRAIENADGKDHYIGGVIVFDDIWIKGQVVSSDRSGNLYKEVYIQDETGGIDLKLGRGSIYSEFPLGMWVYVNCKDLKLGAYNGMPQLGAEPDNTDVNEYETSYIDPQAIIDMHVKRGPKGAPVAPAVITEQDIKDAVSAGFTGELWGKYVTIKGLKYSKEVFALLYPNPSLPHKSANPENRIFLSEAQWGIDTWGMSAAKTVEYARSGVWDTAEVGSGRTRYGAGSILKTPAEVLPAGGAVLESFGPDKDVTYKDILIKYATANYVSHYFKAGSTDIQIRTSGYAKFSDEKLDPDVYAGTSTIDVTGILSIYSGAAQFTLVDEPAISVKVN